MKGYPVWKIQEECAALSNATLSLYADANAANQAFAVRAIYRRLSSFVREYVESLDREAAING